ncbi:MAG: glycosyltransferase family 2 protein [Okeania sp. SIO2G4]|uniref:hormogonium polysaccharide biosynthesis glycosyltransferase HpsE n=1 Tax=unclassified Okeania TaxID=2634635 RepID=UPI0013BD57A0|nr:MULTISPECIES: hormogonium polysaccharide biosynthesis glycosyltransferase HpsE [unclassified Okeania]NEP74919.1 glycosyltransferase family 2 protein [Okeania sp. SIO2G5]NEP96004.1 glycosyltransferase family 2 protein [Okeania sp. SIO2F5]NEQ93718.1 glycosyltransferase family 2 protein [Okeania sp. SIO2G4]
MFQFTIAICTYNGETRLGEVLEKLSHQLNQHNISWEVLVVDNNSQDKTAECVCQYQTLWAGKIELRYTFESKQGLAFARQTAIEKARGKLVGFIDDDNLPQEDWLEKAYLFAESHPQVGAFGGQIEGAYQKELPKDFDKIASFLAVIDRGKQALIYPPEKRILPPGAGLVVLRQAWLDCVPKKLFLAGRTGNSMLASEDLEALSYIQRGGWEIWHNPQMVITHKIPPYRLEKKYLLSLVRGVGLARHHIRMIRISSWQKPLAVPIYIANDLRKILLYYLQHRKHCKTELSLACEMEFLWSTLLSPFYLCRKQLYDYFRQT